MKVKIRAIVLVFVVHLYGAQPKPQEALGASVLHTPTDVDLFEGYKSNKQLEKESRSFKRFKGWVAQRKEESQRLIAIKDTMLEAYRAAQDLDPYAEVENESFLLATIITNIEKAQKIARQDISPDYWQSNEGRTFLVKARLYLDAIDEFIAVFVTGALDEYLEDDSSKLDQMWRAIDFELIPQSKN